MQQSTLDRAIGASCSLDDAARLDRTRDWRSLRERSSIHVIPRGLRLTFDEDHSMFAVADLAQRESECCPFYEFTVHVSGDERYLDITAGPRGDDAVRALLGL